MSIGNLNKSYYADNGTYKFKLVWGGKTVDSSGINKEVIWTQTSWLEDLTIEGFQEIGTSGYVTGISGTGFSGLGKSSSNKCVVDGDASSHGNWWNCVGALVKHEGGIPGPQEKIASSMHLYIWAPEIKETNYALDFDGTNDYVSANGAALALNSSDNTSSLPLSVSAWVYPDNGTKSQLIFGLFKKDSSFAANNYASINGPSVWIGDNDYHFNFYDKINTSSIFSSTTYAINNWHHVVLTIADNGSGVLYVNGSSALTISQANGEGGLDLFSIGVDYDAAGAPAQYFDGKIDEVAVWNVELTSAEVTAIYNSGNMLNVSSDSGNYASADNLSGYYRFNEGSGTSLQDNSSNSNTGTIAGAIWTAGFVSE
jgi:hypothetical protein